MLLNYNRTLSMNTLGQPFFNSLQIANVCALNAKNPQIIKEGFSGNQDALRLPSKKKPAQSQVK
jgi:hypothetical protein